MSVSRHGKSKRGAVHPNANGAEIGTKYPVLRTKLQQPPVAPDILPRARLLDRLNEGRQRTLTLISAPAGYGKRILASRWVAERDSPSGWASLDGSDSDLRMFLHYVLAAIRSLFPKTQLQTEALLEASQLPSAERLAALDAAPDGRFLRINRRFFDIVGYSQEGCWRDASENPTSKTVCSSIHQKLLSVHKMV